MAMVTLEIGVRTKAGESSDGGAQNENDALKRDASERDLVLLSPHAGTTSRRNHLFRAWSR